MVAVIYDPVRRVIWHRPGRVVKKSVDIQKGLVAHEFVTVRQFLWGSGFSVTRDSVMICQGEQRYVDALLRLHSRGDYLWNDFMQMGLEEKYPQQIYISIFRNNKILEAIKEDKLGRVWLNYYDYHAITGEATSSDLYYARLGKMLESLPLVDVRRYRVQDLRHRAFIEGCGGITSSRIR